MARIIKITALLVALIIGVRAVSAVVVQSVPPGLDVFGFVYTSGDTGAVTDSIEKDPEVHFYLAKKTDGLVSPIKHYVQGFLQVKNNPWYFLNTAWFVLLTLALGLGLLVFLVGLVNFVEGYPVFAHSVRENNLMLSFALVPLVGLLGLKYLVLAIVFLGFSFCINKRSTSFGSALMVLLLISVISLSFVRSSILTCVSKDFRQMVDVNMGYSLTPAEALNNQEGFNKRFSYALSLQLSGNLEEAVELYRQLLDTRKDPRVSVNLGNCYFMLGRIEEARQAYEDALKAGEIFSAYYNLSVLERENLNFKKADEFFQKASELDLDRITSLKGTTLYAPMVLNEYISPWELSIMGLKDGLKKAFHVSNLSFMAVVAISIVLLPFSRRLLEDIKQCPKCGRVYCLKCERMPRERKICSLCFQSLVDIRLPLERRVAHLVASQQYRARKRKIHLVENIVFPWIFFTAQEDKNFIGIVLGGLLCLSVSAFVASRLISFNTIEFLKPVGTISLLLFCLIYISAILVGYRTYRKGGF